MNGPRLPDSESVVVKVHSLAVSARLACPKTRFLFFCDLCNWSTGPSKYIKVYQFDHKELQSTKYKF